MYDRDTTACDKLDGSETEAERRSRREFLRWMGVAPGAALVVGSMLSCNDDPVGNGGDTGAGTDSDSQEVGDDAGQNYDQYGPIDGGGGDLGECPATGSDVLGPFFIEGAPERTQLADVDEAGDRLFLGGVVYEPDCSTPVIGALLDVWQADANGDYHDDTTNYRLRGQLLTDAEGRWSIETVKPGNYPLSGSMRPAHIHFTVSSPGLISLTTQLYFEGDEFLQPNDPCGGCASGDPTLIIPLDSSNGVLNGVFNIVLRRA